MQRVAVIGNAGGGKTSLSRLLGEALGIPVHHVDSIQYRSGWVKTPETECDRVLNALAASPRWIIDGFGSDAVIEGRLRAWDTVIFVDFPLLVHYWRVCKRRWHARQQQRAELPENCPEFTLSYSWKLAKVMWQVHRRYRPWFTRLMGELPESVVVIPVRSPNQCRALVDRYRGQSTPDAAPNHP